MAFDLEAARAAGVPDEDIVKSLASRHNYDYEGAINAGYPLSDIIGTLVEQENTVAPLREAVTDRLTAWEKFSYGWDSTTTDVGNWGDYLESKFPIGSIGIVDGSIAYISPDEKYGAGFSQMTPDQRRERIQQVKADSVYTQNKALIDSGFLEEKDNQAWYEVDAATAGIFLKSLSTPTTLIAAPEKLGARGVSLAAGLLSGEMNMAEQLAKTGEIKPQELATLTAAGAAGGFVLGKTVSTIQQKIANRAAVRAERLAIEDAAATVDNIENVLIEEIAAGTPVKEIPKIVTSRLNLAPEEVAAAINKSGRRVIIPSTQEALTALEVRNSAFSNASSGAFKDNWLSIMSTAMREISEPVLGRVRKFDFATHTKKAELNNRIAPFVKGFTGLSKQTQRSASIALYNGELDDAAKIISRENPALVPELNKVKGVLSELHGQLKDAGYRDLGYLENYFPRQVKDYASLTKKLNTPQQTILLTNLKSAGNRLGIQAKTVQGYINALPESEVIDVFNKTLRGVVPNKAAPGFTKIRTIQQITDDILDEYTEAPVSLVQYINKAVDDIELRSLFGRDSTDKGVRSLDLDKTIGSFVAREIKEGNVNPDQADRLAELLKARFVTGTTQPHAVLRDLKSIGYMTTLANPVSAATQLQDLGMSAVMNGMRNTISAMLKRNIVSVSDLGLDNVIAAEISSPSTISKWLDRSLRLSGFHFTDRLGKNVFINSAFSKFTSLAKSEGGIKAIRNKYGKIFGEETEQLLNDLKAENMTDNVKYLLWNELADVQPIALSEMPIKYLQSPNGRILYSMKTFALRQLDLMRRNIIDEYAKGNKKEALKFLVSYMTVIPLMGASVDQLKNAMLGREAALENIPDEYATNVIKLFGVSSYLTERYLGQGQVSQFVANTLMPPVGWLDAVVQDINAAATKEDLLPEKTLSQLPIGGRIWYQWLGGGIEKDAANRK